MFIRVNLDVLTASRPFSPSRNEENVLNRCTLLEVSVALNICITIGAGRDGMY